MYLPEEIRQKIIDRISATATTSATFYRAASSAMDAKWPAFILEYDANENNWAGTESDRKVFMFRLSVAYRYDPKSEATRELAEKAISDAIGELYRVTFEKPDALELPNGWVRASNVSWGYGATASDIPLRIAEMQVAVTVNQPRS